MTAARELPSQWAQAFPRSVGLEPDGFLVPAATLRHLLSRNRPAGLIYTGYAFEPWLPSGARFRVLRGVEPARGDLIVCDVEGWADLRRVIERRTDGALLTALDAHSGGRAVIPGSSVLGIATGVPGAGGWLGRSLVRVLPLWSRVAAFLHWRRQILEAPIFGEEARASVRDKYQQQVRGYVSMIGFALEPKLMALLRERVAPGGEVLVSGSGAGGEALQLAREGYRVTGVDFAPDMIEAARHNARSAGLEIEFLEADIVTLDLGARRFAAIYATPSLYSFIARRAHRVAALRRCGSHLVPGGAIVFSAHLYRHPAERLQSFLAWVRRRKAGAGVEIGDWYTRFLTTQGRIGLAFLRRFTPSEVIREATLAGFERVARLGRAHFVASAFRGGTG